MGRVEGKVALITGAARGQGRSHAVRLAEEGADIIAVDLCQQIDTVPYQLAGPDDLAETTRIVEKLGRRIISRQADVRDLAGLEAVVAEGISELGRLDSYGRAWELSEEAWNQVMDVNLTSVWKTVRSVVPHLITQQQGGSLILTSSVGGLTGLPNLAHYSAAKHGVVGLMRNLAVELAPYGIRANTIHPTGVDTTMIHNPASYELFFGMAETTREQAAPGMMHMHALPIPWVDPIDISNAVLYLASDESRYVTGTTHVIDAGSVQPFKVPHS
jgi:SDR family mycofactocin-dependent oxidoreductase